MGGVCIVPHWPNMGRSPYRPDFRSPTSKIRDMQLLRIAFLMKLRKVEVVQNQIVDVVPLCIFGRLGHKFDLVTFD